MTVTKHGGIAIESPEIIRRDVLSALPYEYAGRRDIEIVIRHPEYTSVCPITGLPDFGCITVTYRPGQRIIELKSLKYYLLQYRSVGIFYEHLANRIMDDLAAVLQPKCMQVKAEFTTRGGLTSEITAEYTSK